MDALQDNVEEFYNLLPESVKNLVWMNTWILRNHKYFIVDGKKFSEIHGIGQKVGDFIIQYYGKNGEFATSRIKSKSK